MPGPDDPPAPPPEPIEVVASAAVAPLLERVAGRFGAAAGRVEPLVRGTTEADALAAFCGGAGGDAPDLLGIARRLRQAGARRLRGGRRRGGQRDQARPRGAGARDRARGAARDIELGELWLAFSDLMPGADGLVPSTLQRWPEIDPEQPEGELPSLLGMPGPRQLVALSELGLSRGCLAFPAVEASPLRDAACAGVRRVQRGQSVELAESGIPAALATGAIDLALMTFAGFDAGRTALRPFRINGVEPSLAGIRDGSYQLAQPLHLYVKLARSGRQPGLAAYLATLTGEAAIGPSGDLAALGLVPLSRSGRLAARQAARSLPALALGGPNLLPIAPIAQPNQVWTWASAAEMALRSAGLPPLPGGDTYRCNVVAARFGSCRARLRRLPRPGRQRQQPGARPGRLPGCGADAEPDRRPGVRARHCGPAQAAELFAT